MPATSEQQLRIVILISGRGSNMQALVQAIKQEQLPVEVAAVVANRPDAAGIQWAQSQGIDTNIIDHHNYASRASFDAALSDYLMRIQPDYILLAGFMRVLGADLVARFDGKIINIHPSLLPSFAGLHTHEQALKCGVQVHGCTVHFVTPVLDNGPIIAQGIIPVLNSDSTDTLAARLLKVEHQVYTQVLRWLAADLIQLLPDGKVLVADNAHRAIFDASLNIHSN